MSDPEWKNIFEKISLIEFRSDVIVHD